MVRWRSHREYLDKDAWWETTLAGMICLRCSGQGGFKKEKRELGSRQIERKG